MSFRLTDVTVNDGKDIGRNNTLAFWTDPSWRLGWTIPLETLVRCNEMRGPANLLRDRNIKRYQKAVSEDGKLVGYIRFRLPDGDKWGDAWLDAKVPDVSYEERKRLEELSAGGSKEWETGIRELPVVDEPVSAMNKKFLEEKPGHMVHPDYWNKGIGTSLVKRGVEMADELGLDMYVLSFEGGYRTYKAFGFKTLEHMELDDSIYGGAGVFHRYFMERKYKGKPQAGREVGQDASE